MHGFSEAKEEKAMKAPPALPSLEKALTYFLGSI